MWGGEGFAVQLRPSTVINCTSVEAKHWPESGHYPLRNLAARLNSKKSSLRLSRWKRLTFTFFSPYIVICIVLEVNPYRYC